jgi:hypothetical protein
MSAFSIAASLAMADRDGRLAGFLEPRLSPQERTVAMRRDGFWVWREN